MANLENYIYVLASNDDFRNSFNDEKVFNLLDGVEKTLSEDTSDLEYLIKNIITSDCNRIDVNNEIIYNNYLMTNYKNSLLN